MNLAFRLAFLGLIALSFSGCASTSRAKVKRELSSAESWRYLQCELPAVPDAARVSLIHGKVQGDEGTIEAIVNKKKDGQDHYRSRVLPVTEQSRKGGAVYESPTRELSVSIQPIVFALGGQGFPSEISGSFVDAATGRLIKFQNKVICNIQ